MGQTASLPTDDDVSAPLAAPASSPPPPGALATSATAASAGSASSARADNTIAQGGPDASVRPPRQAAADSVLRASPPLPLPSPPPPSYMPQTRADKAAAAAVSSSASPPTPAAAAAPSLITPLPSPSPSAAARSRRISRHLSSLGLLQQQSRTSRRASVTASSTDASVAGTSSSSPATIYVQRPPMARGGQDGPRILGGGSANNTSNSPYPPVSERSYSLRRRIHGDAAANAAREASPLRYPTERRSSATSFIRSSFSRMRNSLVSSSTAAAAPPLPVAPPPPPPPPPAEGPRAPAASSTRISIDSLLSRPSTARSSDVSLVPEPTYFRRRPPRPSTATTPATVTATGLTPLPLLPTSAPPLPPLPPLSSPRRRTGLGSALGGSRPLSSSSWNTPPRDSTVSDFLGESAIRERPDEDQAAMLSRLLSIAAAATAASLVGNSGSSVFSNTARRRRSRNPGSTDEAAGTTADDAEDILSSFSGVPGVDSGSSTTSGHNSDSADGDNSVDGSFDGFLRALQNGGLAAELRNETSRMRSSEAGNGEAPAPLNFFRMFRFGSNAGNNHSNNGGTGARMVPVIIVGIRSVNSRNNDSSAGGGDGADESAQSFLENLPLSLGATASGSGHTRATGATRTRRSDSTTAANTTPRPRRGNLLFDDDDIITSRSDDEDDDDDDDDIDMASDEDRSDDEDADDEDYMEDIDMHSEQETFPRRRSQRSRRSQDTNGDGVVPPSGTQASPNTRSSSGVRSWIIYVLGGQYPENHPILTTPSLFTDTPTYEDMLLLSSFIGPAKPPVASQQDVQSSGGVTTATEAEAGERCLVCLSDFELGEECRKLQQCGHLFHRSCIDEWLTTGRNSCPLCRAVGVTETKMPSSAGASSSDPVDSSST
ncbi:uncharacterized protein V1518DRAFT_423902 [Limtongia smithiae]|uniref:uncharacterized protein n=1 Tax=Limtongia smithiae TaxID=1125753 RepID=UPI0034CFEC0E